MSRGSALAIARPAAPAANEWQGHVPMRAVSSVCGEMDVILTRCIATASQASRCNPLASSCRGSAQAFSEWQGAVHQVQSSQACGNPVRAHALSAVAQESRCRALGLSQELSSCKKPDALATASPEGQECMWMSPMLETGIQSQDCMSALQSLMHCSQHPDEQVHCIIANTTRHGHQLLLDGKCVHLARSLD